MRVLVRAWTAGLGMLSRGRRWLCLCLGRSENVRSREVRLVVRRRASLMGSRIFGELNSRSRSLLLMEEAWLRLLCGVVIW